MDTSTLSDPSLSHLLRFISKEERAKYPMASMAPMSGWFIVTPEVAQAWLASNTDNFRPLSGKTAEMFAGDMQRGAWEPNPQPVSFLEGGTLADGQHRLTALASGDAAVVLHVCAGVPRAAVNVLDIGRKRTVANVLARQGFKYAAIMGATARLLLARQLDMGEHGSSFSTAKIAELAAQEPGLEAASAKAREIMDTQAVPLFRGSVIAFLMHVIGDPRFDAMLDSVASQSGMTSGSPALALLRRQVKMAMVKSSEREARVSEAAVIALAWMHQSAGRSVSVLKSPKRARWAYLPGIDYRVSEGSAS